MVDGTSTRKIKVWDVPVRLFHWTFVVLILLAWFSGEWRGERFAYHAYIGYAAGIVLFFRVLWGFVGSSYAKFTDFVYSPVDTVRYGIKLLKLSPPRYVGHNPLGGWMIVAMIVFIGLTIVTGILGPIWHDMEEVHEFLGENIILLLVALHLIGVIADSILTRENLARAMIFGSKPAELYEGSPPDASGGGAKRAVIVALVSLVVGIGGAYAIDLKGIVDVEVNRQVQYFERRAAERAAAQAEDETVKAAPEIEQQGQDPGAN